MNTGRNLLSILILISPGATPGQQCYLGSSHILHTVIMK